MICVEGYKAFHGVMIITPVITSHIPPFEIEDDWLYKPDTQCWYGGGRSFSKEICKVKSEVKNEI